ncbi:MAG TPA: thioesterase family protein [Hyphomicrobiaceae bacterium]|jgi:4-hydroxybenzoyl-CoA thioesterase|nr:thioesterase family protein [Hyphomicrobiaceae bacterium]
MLSNERLVRVQWGDCDPAGIVFYPRYFEWFDASTILLFEKATGLTKIKMLEKYGGAGLALLEARAVFKVASQYGDDIRIETRITEFRRSTFFVHHRVTRGDTLALEGFETRLWTVRDTANGNRLKSGTMPPEIIAAFAGG